MNSSLCLATEISRVYHEQITSRAKEALYRAYRLPCTDNLSTGSNRKKFANFRSFLFFFFFFYFRNMLGARDRRSFFHISCATVVLFQRYLLTFPFFLFLFAFLYWQNFCFVKEEPIYRSLLIKPVSALRARTIYQFPFIAPRTCV